MDGGSRDDSIEIITEMSPGYHIGQANQTGARQMLSKPVSIWHLEVCLGG